MLTIELIRKNGWNLKIVGIFAYEIFYTFEFSATPFGQLPVIEFNGQTFNQSRAICRFIAAQVGLNGINDLEDLEIDAVVDLIYDLRLSKNFKIKKYVNNCKLTEIREVFYENDEKVKAEKKKILQEVQIPNYIGILEKAAETNGGFLALDRLTWADLFLAAVEVYFSFCAEIDITKNAPNLKKIIEKVSKIESIKKWVEKRPKTNFWNFKFLKYVKNKILLNFKNHKKFTQIPSKSFLLSSQMKDFLW